MKQPLRQASMKGDLASIRFFLDVHPRFYLLEEPYCRHVAGMGHSQERGRCLMSVRFCTSQ